MVPGFKVSAAASGMRYVDRPDLALIVVDSAVGGPAAGVFTKNRFTAAPVLLCREHLNLSRTKAVLVNAGIANACTGEEGINRAREMARLAAEALDTRTEAVLVASTGIIGRQVEIEPVKREMRNLVESARPDRWNEVARAIMTTDLVPKMACAEVCIGGTKVTIGGVAKGSGMIAPDMATLLVFVCTDASIDGAVLNHWARRGADHSFNCITVDGDTSTNDSLIVVSSGAAGNPALAEVDSPDSLAFGEALEAVLLELAKKVVLDGEGATKFIEIQVTGAPDESSGKAVALTIANSPLVKTAFFGEDANWGRIVAAAGRAGVPLVPEQVTLYFNGVCVFRAGTPLTDADTEEKAARVFRGREIEVCLDLGMGAASYTAFTCDLSYDYVKINASYRS
ncbi:MAG: bifunctional glutamate N-acetyltransferase/amino-acid acetyltransferase ArgJ [Syntrophobacteraceae bacterium]|nr:bifunctional glutamate N-acetyltransferase/amino-acid acetyltransferase ArgJ [Syntrophobacteraceae bacterium]